MEVGVKREDPMSQESQGESPNSSILTSCTISQCIVGHEIPSIFYGELHNFNVLKDDDGDIDSFVEYHEMAKEINICSSKVNECLDELCDETLKTNDDELSFLIDEGNDVINAFVSSLALERDFCCSHQIEAVTSQNEVLDDNIFKQQNVACVKHSNLQINAMLNEYSFGERLCDGICLSIRTIRIMMGLLCLSMLKEVMMMCL
ncbi:hypothetical protein L7F22_030881 [Adiantum nelumboides]|nr:hypothetical protein [Adiantum nelumboides]